MLWPTSVCWSVLLLLLVASLCGGSFASNQTSEDSLGDKSATTIINGQAIPQGRFPFMAALVADVYDFCCASIISPRFLLTAAHCVRTENNRQLEAFRLRVGVGSVYQTNMTWHKVASVWSHPDFERKHLQNGNDIALLKLAEPLTLQKGRVETIELASAGAQVPRLLGVLGWGITRNLGYELVEQLRGVDVNTIDLEKCYRIANVRVPNTMFCDQGNNKGSCNGDSGSPLFNVANGTFVQHGIVSGSIENHCGDRPGFHTKVSAFTDQIMKIISAA